MANCNIQVDDLNDAIDELSTLILSLPAKTTDVDKLKQGILAIKKEANPCGLNNNNANNNNANNNKNNGNNTNNASNPGSIKSRKTRKRKFYRR